ncbi:MAG TPA: DUF4440 domain-containing protein [Terriglobales bacterium]|nr:DUF4440 domain-containing protein [Terriglobales bacterium]
MRAFARSAVPLLIALLTVVGCASGPKRITSLDTASIKLAVDGVIKASNAAIAARDTAAIAELYADDAVLLPANLPRVEGRDAIRRWWAEGFTAPGLDLVLSPGNTIVSEAGDLAIVIGRYGYKAEGPAGAILREVGKFVMVLKPVGDRWKIVVDTWNSDAQPPAAQPR